ncbi:MAG: hypothetical protein WC621_00990 [Patescibacteria group bacterium]
MISPAPKFYNTKDIKNELDKIPHLGYEFLSKDKNLYTHTLLFLGILNRTYEFTDSAIWSIDNNRPQTAANMFRALIETLGFAYHSWEQTLSGKSEGVYKKMVSLFFGSRQKDAKFQSVNILTCIDKAVKMFPQLRQSYDDISEVVHPNSKSLAYSGKAVGKKEDGKVEFRIPFYEFKADDKAKITNQVGECCYYIQSLCREALENLKKT